MRRLLSLLAFTVACGSDSTGPASSLVTTVALSRDIVTPYDSVTIRVAVTNPTSRAVELHGTTPCFITFAIQAPGQPEVLADPRTCAAVLEPVLLRPRERRDAQIPWDLTVAGQPLPLGPYSVRAGLSLANQQGLQVRSQPKLLQIGVFGR